MSSSAFDRSKLHFKALKERRNRVFIERDHVLVDGAPGLLTDKALRSIEKAATDIKVARQNKRPVVLAFGAHAVKNGLAPLLIRFLEDGWLTHLATNGAAIIHDWEFAYQGASSEDVRKGIERGEFGLWQETGFSINLALIVGAYGGLGYGESIGALVHNDGLLIPERAELLRIAQRADQDPGAAARAADLLWAMDRFDLEPGFMSIPHPYKRFGLQAAAYRLKIPYTGHPMFGHDIIYTHPMNLGAAVGRTAQTDFLRFAEAISRIEAGIYLSVGSAVMSPMIFEKSLSMAQNLALQDGKRIENHKIYICDLEDLRWDWSKGEPPVDNPAYYVRYCKTFSRMGGEMHYIQADNRDLLLALYWRLRSQ